MLAASGILLGSRSALLDRFFNLSQRLGDLFDAPSLLITSSVDAIHESVNLGDATCNGMDCL